MIGLNDKGDINRYANILFDCVDTNRQHIAVYLIQQGMRTDIYKQVCPNVFIHESKNSALLLWHLIYLLSGNTISTSNDPYLLAEIIWLERRKQNMYVSATFCFERINDIYSVFNITQSMFSMIILFPSCRFHPIVAELILSRFPINICAKLALEVRLVYFDTNTVCLLL